MKLIDRYLLREHLIPVFYCLTGLSMIFVIVDLFEHLGKFLEAKTPLHLILRYYLCSLAPTMDLLAPAALLLATLYTLWQFTRHNELTAMRASGLSLRRIMAPFLGVGIAFSLLLVGIKEFAAPSAARWAEDFSNGKFSSVKSNTVYYDRAYYNETDKRLWHVEEFDTAMPHRLSGVKVTQERRNRSREQVYIADRAEYLDGQWWFFNLQTQPFDANDNPTGNVKPTGAPSGGGVEIPGFTETPESFLYEITPWEYLSSMQMAAYLRQRPMLSKLTRAEKRFDLHRRLAMPWACLIVTLFGIPAGAKTGRQSALSGIFFALFLFFGFYALMQLGVVVGKREILPPWMGAWLSNIVFFAAGIGMLSRMK